MRRKTMLTILLCTILCLSACNGEETDKSQGEVGKSNVASGQAVTNEADNMSIELAEQDATETELKIPTTVDTFYLDRNGVPVADENAGTYEDYAYYGEAEPNTFRSYKLVGEKWVKYEGEFGEIRRINEYETGTRWVFHEENGDYIVGFRKGIRYSYDVLRIGKKGKVKQKVSIDDILRKSDSFVDNVKVQKLIYAGDGKAFVQCQNYPYYEEVQDYDGKNLENLYVIFVDLTTEEVIKEFSEGWRLCDVISDKAAFLEHEKEIQKFNIETGEFVKNYSTAPLWEQAELSKDENAQGALLSSFGIQWTSYEGELYAKNVSGIYKLDEENQTWKQLVSQATGDFSVGCYYEETFRMLSENEALILGCFSGDAVEKCFKYEW